MAQISALPPGQFVLYRPRVQNRKLLFACKLKGFELNACGYYSFFSACTKVTRNSVTVCFANTMQPAPATTEPDLDGVTLHTAGPSRRGTDRPRSCRGRSQWRQPESGEARPHRRLRRSIVEAGPGTSTDHNQPDLTNGQQNRICGLGEPCRRVTRTPNGAAPRDPISRFPSRTAADLFLSVTWRAPNFSHAARSA
jgi:hypothetical protein